MCTGRLVILKKLENSPKAPGIYQMLDENKKIIYIGKAKNLYKRLTSYVRDGLPIRLQALIAMVRYVDFVITTNESQALFLEANLIKKYQPKFNILLKDDKFFSYIKISVNHDFPRISQFRGKMLEDGVFYGPFASSKDTKKAITDLQKIFKLRPCSDQFFSSRNRPCLQYQIKCCYAPCVGKISKTDYLELLSQARDFLDGKNAQLQQLLSRQMYELSQKQEYEQAAEVRDRIKALSYIQIKSSTDSLGIKDLDLIVLDNIEDIFCVQISIYRGGKSYGNKSYFPMHTLDSDIDEVMSSSIKQLYFENSPPPQILVNYLPINYKEIENSLDLLYSKKVKITIPKSKKFLELLNSAKENVRITLREKLHTGLDAKELIKELQELLNLPNKINRIEVYDNSHISGENAIGAMIVADSRGLLKSEYRYFNITLPNSLGDDYSMLREVLSRRLKKLKIIDDKKPDLIIIDGGKGHLSTAIKVMDYQELQIPIMCISKGKERNAGKEMFHIKDRETFTLSRDAKLMRYLQILRDEAHHFAINAHRRKRSAVIGVSELDKMQNVGPKRKKALLSYFGSLQAIKNATVLELSTVNGISKAIAENIFQALHRDDN